MKRYVYIRDGMAYEIIPEVNPAFPTTPIEERYPADFLSQCIVADEGVEVMPNYIYDPDTGTFSAPAPEEVIEASDGEVELDTGAE